MWFFLLLFIRFIGTDVRPRNSFAKYLDMVAGKNDYISLCSSRKNHVLTKFEPKKKKRKKKNPELDLLIYLFALLASHI